MTFDEFLDLHLPALGNYAGVLAGDRQAAHDVLVDALITVQLRWDRIGRMASPAGYARRVITTTFLDARRTAARRRTFSTNEPPERLHHDDGPSRVDDRDQLADMLDGLPDRQRAAVVLRFYLDLPDEEIAAALDCSKGAVRTLISRGLQQLRAVVQASGPSQPRVGRHQP
ncbi:sigma-70 family RNA polymerase sigma factor [Nakamurella alba]|uniref:sigma-70 family RNA polymerase sigma factor n=1 Tax=Nakamurella alba TaxID=2665158 RepID=UPI0012B9E29D|nr:sigma-70 family RNA polymerase sigma factor [Nakamurella alba]